MSNEEVSSTRRRYANCLRGYNAITTGDQAAFIRWLERQPPGTLFGSGSDDCALARWSGHDVGFVTYSISGYLPTWANEFVVAFCDTMEPLTVERALRIARRTPS